MQLAFLTKKMKKKMNDYEYLPDWAIDRKTINTFNNVIEADK